LFESLQPDKNETPYHILLQQQQLFLQWQLEFNGSPPINVNNLDKFDKSSMIITSTATTSPINVTSPTLLNSSPGHFQTISQQTVTSPTTLGQPQLASQGNIVIVSAYGFSLSINCGLGPDTGKLRFFSSAFKSVTFISSKLANGFCVTTFDTGLLI
jgi:hypothetical protein